MLTEINRFRALHGADPVTLDPTISAYSQKWADNCVFEYSPSPREYGESIGQVLPEDIVDGIIRWEKEGENYDYSQNTFDPMTADFTQLVWKATKRIGVGLGTCAGKPGFDGTDLLVVNFDPPGNYSEEFIENVGKPNSA
ncbi:CAP family protein [Streptomyces sp. NPDC051567]|uniref:CAP family protein n=1 Tax=Streptomyces sp. NPDC051567 TaxID=3365660 RepID=UPI0037A60C50